MAQISIIRAWKIEHEGYLDAFDAGKWKLQKISKF